VPKEKSLSEDQQVILQILDEEAPNPVPTAEVAERAGKSVGNIINILNRLKGSGFVFKVGRGLWGLSQLTNSLPVKGEFIDAVGSYEGSVRLA